MWHLRFVELEQRRFRLRARLVQVRPRDVARRQVRALECLDVPFDTIEGNIEALKSPNLATRYIAWTNLHKAGAKAEPALLKFYESKVPHERARALWLLGRIDGKGQHHLKKAIQDDDPNIRITAIRLTRRLKLNGFLREIVFY